MKELLFLFMVFSIIGWLWETPWVSLRSKKFINRGFLHGPYIPIYGCALITIVLSMSIFDAVTTITIWIVLIEMFYMSIITASWEFMTSWSLEKIFHTRWWDYSDHKFNLDGRISLSVSIFFGVGGYVLWRFVLPPFDSLYTITPPLLMTLILIIFYIVFLIDSYFTLRDLFNIRDMMNIIERISRDLGIEVETKLSELKREYQTKKGNLLRTILDVKTEFQTRYEKLQETSIKNRIKTELDKVTTMLTTNKNIIRMYLKYPKSYSLRLPLHFNRSKNPKTPKQK